MRRWPNRLRSPGTQQGVVLVVGLMFLLLFTLLGVTAGSSTNLQERMAGNTRDRELAFESAECALNYIIDNLVTLKALTTNNSESDGGFDASSSADTCTADHIPSSDCYYALHGNDAAYWRSPANWTSHFTTNCSTSLLAAAPVCVLEKMPTVDLAEHYRATCRGTGANTRAIAVLQTILSYTP